MKVLRYKEQTLLRGPVNVVWECVPKTLKNVESLITVLYVCIPSHILFQVLIDIHETWRGHHSVRVLPAS